MVIEYRGIPIITCHSSRGYYKVLYDKNRELNISNQTVYCGTLEAMKERINETIRFDKLPKIKRTC